MYFAPLLKGFPLELGFGGRGQKLEWWGYRAEKEVWRYLQPSGYNTRTWRACTDVQTDTGRQHIPRFRISSRGKNARRYSLQQFKRWSRPNSGGRWMRWRLRAAELTAWHRLQLPEPEPYNISYLTGCVRPCSRCMYHCIGYWECAAWQPDAMHHDASAAFDSGRSRRCKGCAAKIVKMAARIIMEVVVHTITCFICTDNPSIVRP